MDAEERKVWKQRVWKEREDETQRPGAVDLR